MRIIIFFIIPEDKRENESLELFNISLAYTLFQNKFFLYYRDIIFLLQINILKWIEVLPLQVEFEQK